jgi:L-alanine-DL-glutamate epimerase-like enolase superfamily enzyme
MNRRQMIKSAGAAVTAGLPLSQLLQPVKTLAVEAKRVRIQNIDVFAVQLPAPTGQAAPPAGAFGGPANRLVCTRVETEAGIRGYSFVGGSTDTLEEARKILVGQDLFQVEQHLKRGLINWSHIEEAIWDAIGRIAGQPVCRLLGGAKTVSLPVYLTYVWPGGADQSQVTAKDQAAQAVLLKSAGFKAMKIRIFRPNYMDDVAACSEILAVGGSGFRCMVDRTAGSSGTLWSYPQGLAAALALQKAGVYWLEEPFDRNDFDGPARLAREVDILITGGEGFRGLAAYRECLTHGTYDILQPDCNGVGGILTMRKVGALAEAWGIPVCPHASSGLALAGRVQASAALGSMYQEIGVLTPPQLPNDRITPVMPILNSNPFVFQNGELLVPQGPGLGLDLNEQALNRFKVEGPVTGGRGGGGGGRGAGGGRGGRGNQ